MPLFRRPPVGWSSVSIGPFTIHAYALCILAGIFFAMWYTTRRWVERGGDPDVVGSVAFWAVPFGIVGGRLYHVITSPDQYFGEGGHPIDAFKIWNGGLGIWGAVALGAVGAYIGCRRQGVSFVTFMDSAAPAVLIAQAIGRMGNYFNQELFGRPTDLPWALHVDVIYRPAGFEAYATFHPTFLYELVWNLLGAALIVYLDKRLDLRGGRVFWLYVMVYTSGRLWIESDAHRRCPPLLWHPHQRVCCGSRAGWRHHHVLLARRTPARPSSSRAAQPTGSGRQCRA